MSSQTLICGLHDAEFQKASMISVQTAPAVDETSKTEIRPILLKKKELNELKFAPLPKFQTYDLHDHLIQTKNSNNVNSNLIRTTDCWSW
jgi:hypothetical protein